MEGKPLTMTIKNIDSLVRENFDLQTRIDELSKVTSHKYQLRRAEVAEQNAREYREERDLLQLRLIDAVARVAELEELIEREHDSFNPLLDRYRKTLEGFANSICVKELADVSEEHCPHCIATEALKGGSDE